MSIISTFDNAFRQMRLRGWDCIYIAVDVHGTIFKPTYSTEENYDYYPYAKEVLQKFSNRKDVKLILWTASHPDMLEKYKVKLESDGIHIDYINENPEAENGDFANFDKKFYFNIGLDDKFGFDANNDWLDLKQMLFVMAITRD